MCLLGMPQSHSRRALRRLLCVRPSVPPLVVGWLRAAISCSWLARRSLLLLALAAGCSWLVAAGSPLAGWLAGWLVAAGSPRAAAGIKRTTVSHWTSARGRHAGRWSQYRRRGKPRAGRGPGVECKIAIANGLCPPRAALSQPRSQWPARARAARPTGALKRRREEGGLRARRMPPCGMGWDARRERKENAAWLGWLAGPGLACPVLPCLGWRPLLVAGRLLAVPVCLLSVCLCLSGLCLSAGGLFANEQTDRQDSLGRPPARRPAPNREGQPWRPSIAKP